VEKLGYNQPQVMQQQVPLNKPTAAAVLSIIAGVLGLVFALISLLGVFYLSSLFDLQYYGDYSAFLIIALAEVIWILISSILVIAGGSKIRSQPASHTKWGIVILLFSILGLGLLALSIPDWIGIVGLLTTIMGIVGGILALAFKPTYGPAPYGYQQPYAPQQQYQQYPQQPYQQPYAPQQPYQQPPPQTAQQIKRICPQCGRVVDENLKFCSYCGKQLA
jgi:hypothetical protein